MMLGRALQLMQLGLVVFFLYHILDAYITPYRSEWLTADALVPSLVLAILWYSFCLLATQWVVVFSRNRFAALWLVPIAFPTIMPYVLLLLETAGTR